MIDPKDVTIIIPHLGKSPESRYALRQCLESLEETVPDIKKIVVINGHKFEDDLTLLDGVPLDIHNFSFITLEEQGQCRAVNAAVASTNTPWIFVTNDDMVYAPRWFEKLTEFLSVSYSNPEIDKWEGKIEEFMCISPKLVEPRKGAPTFIECFCGGAGGDFDKEKFLELAKSLKKSINTGFNLPFLIKRELWDTVGGYDINYDPWGSNSDSDLEYRIRLAGVQPYQNENCLVYHFSQTSGTFEPRNSEYWQKNWDYFIKKWGFPRTDEGIWEANFHLPTVLEGRIFQPDWEAKYGLVY